MKIEAYLMENIMYPNISFIDPKYHELTVVVPVYNEELVIASFILKLKKYAKTIILVDDDSQDETINIAEFVNPGYILRNTANIGHYESIKIGLKKAQEIQSKYILILDVFQIYNLKFIDEIMGPLMKNNEIDVSFGIYEDIYDNYQKYQKTSLLEKNSNLHPIKNQDNIVLFIFKSSAIKYDTDIFPTSYNSFINSLLTNKKFTLVRLNVKKPLRKSDAMIASILFFMLASIAFIIFYNIFYALAHFIIPSSVTGLVFVILSILTYVVYRRNLNE